MHKMWCGAVASAEPVWHVLATDESVTLCGLEKREECEEQVQTDKLCYRCMTTLQTEMAPEA
ncbi:hypothetical protein [Streptomyces sp. NPDC092370]|uniref:hypothetical protein n=1 Tax=Streptomyces sp. NPDC092370 TaxID=3366016 RepID=UPI003805E52A